MAGFRINWLGAKVAETIEEATKIGIDQTTSACVTASQEIAPRDTGFMANTMDFEKAKSIGGVITGRWGNWTADYTLWVEIGVRGRAGTYFMRQSADKEYPKLRRRIADAYKGGF